MPQVFTIIATHTGCTTRFVDAEAVVAVHMFCGCSTALLLVSVASAIGATVEMTIVAHHAVLNADGTYLRNPLFNGTLPGPAIVAHAGDTLALTFVNDMKKEGLSIRFQPIKQQNNNHMDGTPFVSEMPILPDGGFRTYTIPVPRPGTYHYHSGQEFMRQTLHGIIVVQPKPGVPEPFAYDAEAVIQQNDGTSYPAVVASDLYHVSTEELAAQLDSNVGDWIWQPQSQLGMPLGALKPRTSRDRPVLLTRLTLLTVNGYGRYNCTAAHAYSFRCTWQCPAADAKCIDEVRCHGTAWGAAKDYVWEDDMAKNGHPGATFAAYRSKNASFVDANIDYWNARCTADHMLPFMKKHHAWAAHETTELKDINGSKYAVVDGKTINGPGDEVHQSQFLNWGRPTGLLCNMSKSTRDERCLSDGSWGFKGINKDRVYDNMRNDDGSYDLTSYDAIDLAKHGALCRPLRFYTGNVQPEGNHNPFGLFGQYMRTKLDPQSPD